MNYTPTQLEMIRLFGKKELTEGCYVLSEWDIQKIIKTSSESTDSKRVMHDMWCGDWIDSLSLSVFVSDFGYPYLQTEEICRKHTWLAHTKPITEILWHSPTLEDIFIKAKGKYQTTGISSLWFLIIHSFSSETVDIKIEYNPCLSPSEQSEATMTKLINL